MACLLRYELLSRLADVQEGFQTRLQGEKQLRYFHFVTDRVPVGNRGVIMSYDEVDEGSLDGIFTQPVLDDLGHGILANDFSSLLS